MLQESEEAVEESSTGEISSSDEEYEPIEASSSEDCEEFAADSAPGPSKKKRKLEKPRIKRVVDDAIDETYEVRCSSLNLVAHAGADYKNLSDRLKVNSAIWEKLYDFQKHGVEWMAKMYSHDVGGILADEMGLGKTIQALVFLNALKDSFPNKNVKCLVVCPATLLVQWVSELHEWIPTCRVFVIHSSGTYMSKYKNEDEIIQKVVRLKTGLNVVISTYSTFLRNVSSFIDYEWDTVVLDEGHIIKNPEAQITLAVKALRLSPHRYLLTGSPVQNNLEELWTLIDFVFPGRLGSLITFKEKFIIPIYHGGYTSSTKAQKAVAYECSKVLNKVISDYILRRLKTDVQDTLALPEKTEEIVFCKLTAEQRRLYEEYLQSDDVLRMMERSIDPFIGITNLRKLCNHPDIFKEKICASHRDYKRAGKMVVLFELLKQWNKDETNKTLVFSQSREILKILALTMKAKNYSFLRMDGSIPIKQRQQLVEQFNGNPKVKIFLLTTHVGGVGLNLTAANKVLVYDPDWNPSTDNQAKERAWRIGQIRPVQIFRLVLSGTIEEKIYQRQLHKEFLSKRVLKDARQTQIMPHNVLRELFVLIPEGFSGTQTGALVSAETSEHKPNDRALGRSQFVECTMNHDDLVKDPLLSAEIIERHAKLVAKKAEESVSNQPDTSAFRQKQFSAFQNQSATKRKETKVSDSYYEEVRHKIRKFVETRKDGVPSQVIIDRFKPEKNEGSAFRRALQDVCTLNKKNKRWVLKKGYS